ncbi:hypothetical protein JOD02_001446 [Caldicoprobacter guelmensis]|uniref:DUF6171 family protein n=1 Tax=Caldicoprobacter guelmensis TaxID=1170224 RepID=UPI00195B2DBC|nr:DUF6171 family protein [Caldicoprobacter guelmensis]MBM7582589.1 hypothetical protein [Caldicoprobacter guelmensis]
MGCSVVENGECKGCSATVRLSQHEIEEIFGETLKIRNVKLVTQEEYNARLEICRQCTYLDYGTTCRLCGCLVQIKAKLKGARCPYPYQPKW